MDELTSLQRKHLRGLAQALDAVVIVGKQGVTESLVRAVAAALEAHELVKVRFNEFKDEKGALSEQIREATGSVIPGRIGHVVLFFRRHPDPEKRRIAFPEGPKPPRRPPVI
jgi:RNA-binding protein